MPHSISRIWGIGNWGGERENHQRSRKKWEKKLTKVFSRIIIWGGGIFAPAVTGWFNLLNKVPIQHKWGSALVKTGLDQFAFAPIALSGMCFPSPLSLTQSPSSSFPCPDSSFTFPVLCPFSSPLTDLGTYGEVIPSHLLLHVFLDSRNETSWRRVDERNWKRRVGDEE